MHASLCHDITINHTQCLIIILMHIFSIILQYYCTLTKLTAYSEANSQDLKSQFVLSVMFTGQLPDPSLKNLSFIFVIWQ